MNIIRTAAVELSGIPAIAYKQKLMQGGSGLRIMRLDQDADATFTIDKREGFAQPFGKVDEALFPAEAVYEALDATQGLPYGARGKIKVSVFETKEEPEVDVTEAAAENVIDMVDSDEYKAFVERYSDGKGKMNYTIMNKDLIQFASRSKTVQTLIDERASEEDILVAIIKSRAALLANKKDSLPDDQVLLLMETLDEIDPRSAFKELKNHIRRMQARR